MFFMPVRFSTLTASSQRAGVWGLRSRAFSSIERALMSWPERSSRRDSSSHSGMAPEHFLICQHTTRTV